MFKAFILKFKDFRKHAIDISELFFPNTRMNFMDIYFHFSSKPKQLQVKLKN